VAKGPAHFAEAGWRMGFAEAEWRTGLAFLLFPIAQ
jgi:hypothetical protein